MPPRLSAQRSAPAPEYLATKRSVSGDEPKKVNDWAPILHVPLYPPVMTALSCESTATALGFPELLQSKGRAHTKLPSTAEYFATNMSKEITPVPPMGPPPRSVPILNCPATTRPPWESSAALQSTSSLTPPYRFDQRCEPEAVNLPI